MRYNFVFLFHLRTHLESSSSFLSPDFHQESRVMLFSETSRVLRALWCRMASAQHLHRSFTPVSLARSNSADRWRRAVTAGPRAADGHTDAQLALSDAPLPLSRLSFINCIYMYICPWLSSCNYTGMLSRASWTEKL